VAEEGQGGGGGSFYRWERSDGDRIGGKWSSFKSLVRQFPGRGGDGLMREKGGEEAPLQFRAALGSGVGARHDGGASLGGGGSAVLKEEDDGQLGRMSQTRLHGL
jgi:hypothetical protein